MQLNRRVVSLALVAVLGAGAASRAVACGEVMLHMGGALRYRVSMQHHPARILLYAGSSEQSARASEFEKSLAKAGHEVTTIQTPPALAQALAERRFDVIITLAANLPEIHAQIARSAREPALIPVFERG